MWLSKRVESWLPENVKLRRREKARIAELTNSIDEVWQSEYEDVAFAEKEEAYQIAYSMTQYEMNERDWLIDKPILRDAESIGIVIPKEHFCFPGPFERLTLTRSGRSWLRKEIREYRVAKAKDLVVIITPILSLLLSSAIAILGLLVALKKK